MICKKFLIAILISVSTITAVIILLHCVTKNDTAVFQCQNIFRSIHSIQIRSVTHDKRYDIKLDHKKNTAVIKEYQNNQQIQNTEIFGNIIIKQKLKNNLCIAEEIQTLSFNPICITEEFIRLLMTECTASTNTYSEYNNIIQFLETYSDTKNLNIHHDIIPLTIQEMHDHFLNYQGLKLIQSNKVTTITVDEFSGLLSEEIKLFTKILPNNTARNIINTLPEVESDVLTIKIVHETQDGTRQIDILYNNDLRYQIYCE